MSTYPNHPNERGVRHPGAANANINPGTTFGQTPLSGPAPTTAGHHKHDLLNKLDPRVDSTHDHAPAQAMLGPNNVPSGTYGPHSSRLANALDPRVDSDMDGRGARTGGGGGMVGGMSGGAGAGATAYGGAPEGTYGPHSSRMANTLDPRVDSDRDGRSGGSHGMSGGAGGAYQSGTGTGTGTGYGRPVGGGQYVQPSQEGYMTGGAGSATTTGTAGPHKSSLMNKLDPRVDSKTGLMKESEYADRSQYSDRRGI